MLTFSLLELQFLSFSRQRIDRLQESHQLPKFNSERDAYMTIRYYLWDAVQKGVCKFEVSFYIFLYWLILYLQINPNKDQQEKRKSTVSLEYLCSVSTELYPQSTAIHTLCALFCIFQLVFIAIFIWCCFYFDVTFIFWLRRYEHWWGFYKDVNSTEVWISKCKTMANRFKVLITLMSQLPFFFIFNITIGFHSSWLIREDINLYSRLIKRIPLSSGQSIYGSAEMN